MMKTSHFFKALVVLVSLVAVYSCERDDKEPDFGTKKFSRLYVSFEEYQTSNLGVADTNIRIIFPADSSEFKYSLGHVSAAKGGGPLYFNPFLRNLYQASASLNGVNDTSVYAMNVSDKGVLTNTLRHGNKLYNLVKGLSYHHSSGTMVAVNASPNEAGIYLDNRPANGYARPHKKLMNPNLAMWGGAFLHNNFLTSKTSEGAGIYVFEDLLKTNVGADSTARLEPTRILSIADAQNLRGLSYDSVKNILAVTDFVTNGADGTGRILIFEKFSDLIREKTIVPTRIITGPATTLKMPVDVALDTRATAQYLYVADRSGKVLRFKLSDNGNVAPNKSLERIVNKGLANERKLIPVGLALDARDNSTLGQ